MNRPEEAVDTTVAQFKRQLGSQLVAAYLFGSYAQGYYQPGESDINLMFIVADDTGIFKVRDLFLPVWHKYGHVLKRAPLIIPDSAFSRYKRLMPTLAHHIGHNGRLLAGEDYLPHPPSFDPHEAVARLATEALAVSGALLPEIMDPKIAAAQQVQLRRLARKLWQQPIPKEETAVQIYARVQQKLGPQISRLPAGQLYNNRTVPAVTAPFLPGLQSLYKKADNIVMVLAFLSAQDILRTDWSQMTERLAEECSGLILTTAAQLSLSLVYDKPIELKTRLYQYNWGIDHLAKLQTSRRQIMRHAAIIPTHVAIDELPNALLTEPEDKLPAIIHDFQNKLLNVQLTHELLHRFGDTEKFVPPEPLPARSRPPRERISGIFKHLHWWSEFYTQQMRQAAEE